MTLVCYRCGNEYAGTDLEKTPMCPYCVADRQRAEATRAELTKPKREGLSYIFDEMYASFMSVFSLIIMIFG